MASRRLGETVLNISSNATVLEFKRTDGDSRYWTTNTSRIVDDDNQVNYMRHLDLDSPTSVKWRLNVARAVAMDKGMPESQEYVLADWPEGYRLFDHNKGPVDNPRHDVYLFGHPKARFRSINEFIPHAIWLMRDESMEHASCNCKYCSKKAQKEITASMSNILRSSPTSGSPSPSRPRPVRERKPRRSMPSRPRDRARDSRTYAAVQKRPEITRHAMLVERNADLRAVTAKNDMKLKRWFREGELIWCALDRSISRPDLPEDAAIGFWPALIDETWFKSQVVNHSGVTDPYAYSRAEIDDTQSTGPDQEPPWTVSQYYSYKVHFLVGNATLTVPGDRILPYQAYAPPNALVNAMGAYPTEKLDFTREVLRSFDPCAEQVDFERAVAPYAMALQIGGTLSAYWSLTDEWSATFTVPAPPRPPVPEPSTVTSLQDAIAQAHQYNAQTSNAEASSSMAPKRMCLPEPGSQVTQIRYQGLWWGGERIWADDFIRLKVPRRCLAPAGSENIYPPSGPGKTVKDVWLKQGRDSSELGAGARGIFMRLDALIVVDVPQEDGKPKKEARACGMLFELADLDWEESNQDESKRNGATINPHANGASQPTSTTFEGPQPQPMTESPLPIASGPPLDPSATPSAPTSGSEPKRPTASKHRYLCPEPPQGYRFRPILSEGYEAVISLSLISGRYYPRILSHPLLDDTLRKALTRPPELGGLSEANVLWALEGLCAGYYNSVDPTHYMATRTLMVEEADKVAKQQLEEYVQRTRYTQHQEMGELAATYDMEVDG